jgi:hypothetical protein
VPSEIQSERRPNTSLSEHVMIFRSFTSCSIVDSDISEERADFRLQVDSVWFSWILRWSYASSPCFMAWCLIKHREA